MRSKAGEEVQTAEPSERPRHTGLTDGGQTGNAGVSRPSTGTRPVCGKRLVPNGMQAVTQDLACTSFH